MPNYESNSLYIDFARLPPPKVIEEIDYEALVAIYQNEVVAKKPDLARAVGLEQSPTNVILQAEAYGEMIVRARINAAARAVMLPFATGTDLDVLAAFFNIQRAVITTDPLVTEDDERLRRRVQISTESFTTAGSEGAYIFHALSADPTIRDASAMATDDKGSVKVTLMNSGSTFVPTSAQLLAVSTRLNSKKIRPLTDVITVSAAQILATDVVANVTLYPGPHASLVLADIQAAMSKLRGRVALLGRDLTRSAIISAMNQEGVQGVDLVSPAQDVVANLDQCVSVNSLAVNILDARAE